MSDNLQIITAEGTTTVAPSETLPLTITYTTETDDPAEPVDPTLVGIGLRLHFDSTFLGFDLAEDLSDVFEFALTTDPQVLPDTEDFDGDASTDSFLLVTWADIAGNWPGVVPQDLYNIEFTAPDTVGTTTLNFTASSLAAGFELSAEPVTFTVNNSPVVDEEIEDIDTTINSPIDDINLFDVFGDADDAEADLTFAVSENTNPELLTTTIDPVTGLLSLELAPDASGTATVTVEATDTLGGVATESFSVVVPPSDIPVVNLSIDAVEGLESDAPTFTLTATTDIPVTGDQTVELALEGEAEDGDFVDPIPAVITILDGETTGEVTVTIVDDVDAEGNEDATFTIANPSDGLALGAITTLTFDIDDDENSAPFLNPIAVAGFEDEEVIFAVDDFTNAFLDPDDEDDLVSITIVIPEEISPILDGDLSNGELLNDDEFITEENNIILTADLDDLTFTPAPDSVDDVVFSVTGSDGVLDSPFADVVISLIEVNDPPSFTLPEDPDLVFTPGSEVTIESFATEISAGPASEVGQTLAFDVAVEDDEDIIFTEDGLPAIEIITDETGAIIGGDLTFTLADPTVTDPVDVVFTALSPTDTGILPLIDGTTLIEGLVFDATPAVEGVATATVTLSDDGGTEFEGIDISPEQSFTITSINNVLISVENDIASTSDALFDNLVGLYEVVDEDGGIEFAGNEALGLPSGIISPDGVLTPDDETLDVIPLGASAYAQAIFDNDLDGEFDADSNGVFIPDFEIRAGSNGDPLLNTTSGDVVVDGDAFYAPFVLANSGALGFEGFFAQELSEASVFNNPAEIIEDQVAYFTFVDANPDGVEHIAQLSSGAFGFEDLPSNIIGFESDNDFNDVVFDLGFAVTA